MADTNGRRRPGWKVLAFGASLLAAVLLGAAKVIGADLGSWASDRFGPGEVLISSSATEEVTECGTHLFLEEATARDVVSGAVPTETDWNDFYRQKDAVVVGDSTAEVSIQGESPRTVTLTGIDFEVQRRPRPPGAVFSLPCGGPGTGRFISVDIDRDPVRRVASSSDPEATVGLTNRRPIKFPWTVSITDPLLLYITALAERCYCTWRAVIPWKSGGESGQITVDNDGEGYDVIARSGLRNYSLASRTPTKWVLSPVPPVPPERR
jgi:hypothetical protein